MPPTPIAPPATGPWKSPTLRLRVDDLSHPGAAVFFAAVGPTELLQRAVAASVKWLYTPDSAPTKIEEILLILAPMEGVAGTSGTDTHKEIRLSLDYVLSVRDRAAHEIAGVVVHEMVHCFQHDARGTCPRRLTEGIADYVRLVEQLAPPHWTQRAEGGWDKGYETTAYFLRWLEQTWGEGTVRKLNAALDAPAYNVRVFEDVTGVPVEDLWASYVDALEEGDREPERKEPLDAWPMPSLAMRIDDIEHAGADVFLDAVKPKDVMRAAVMASFTRLYTLLDVPTNVKSITLILRAMDGVAHTCGSAAHKEIHCSLAWLAASAPRARDEITGVLVHEVVHCFQHDARGTCPGGLIEGVADYVRLLEDLAPPHWTRKGGDKWDAGYATTAYFLAWLDNTCAGGGAGPVVPRLNAGLKHGAYNAQIFEELTGKTVDALWAEYCASLEACQDSRDPAAAAETG